MKVGMALVIFVIAAGGDGPPLRLEKTIALSGVEGRFDHFAADPGGRRAYVAALGNNTLEAVDVEAGKRAGTAKGLAEPQGIAFVPEVHRIYVANGRDGKVRMYDVASLRPAGEMEMGEDADNVRYDAARKTIWVGYTSELAAIDTTTGQRTGGIRVDAHPESFQLEKAGPRIFVNVPERGEIEVADREKKKVIAKWAVKAAGANFPMALDEADHRLFTGCRRPAKVLVFDTETGKMTAEFGCPGDTDDLFYDAARKRLYVAGGEGYIEAFAQKSADEYQSLGRLKTAPGARTALFVPEWSRILVAVPHRGAQPAEIRIYSVE